MELIVYISISIPILSILVATLYLLSSNKDGGSGKALRLPPGSTGLPVVGETLAYFFAAKNGTLEKFFAGKKNKYGTSIFKTSYLGENMVFLCSAEANKFLFSNEKTLVQSWWPRAMDKIFVDSEKTNKLEEGNRTRRVLTSFVKPGGLQRYIAIMDESTKKHLHQHWGNNNELKSYPLTQTLTFELACKLFLDVDDPVTVAKLAEPFHEVAGGIMALPVNLPGTRFRRAVNAANELRREIGEIVKKRRADMEENKKVEQGKEHDILGHMVVERYDDGQLLSLSDASNKLFGLIIGAFETTSITLCNILKFLAEFPQVYDKVYQEQIKIMKSKEEGEALNWADIQKMKYSWNVASEVLRLLPPNPGTFREAVNDFVYDGFLVPKGWKIHWDSYATHKSSEYFPDPEKFDPSRFEGNGLSTPFSYVPFGGGPRACPGKEYARAKILVFMHNVVTKYKWERAIPDEKVLGYPNLVPALGMPIRLYPHNN